MLFCITVIAAAGVAGGADQPLLSAASLVALLTLTLMEVVLGIDNVVFVAIIVEKEKLPKEKQALGRNIGMGLALGLRLGLLLCITWVMGLTQPWVPIPEWMRSLLRLPEGFQGFTGKDMILISGGFFLLYKATKEIFEKLEGEHHPDQAAKGGKASFGSVIFQIILLDLVFSLDSVITAVGMVKNLTIMVIAMFFAVGTMIAVAGSIQEFVNKHPSVKILVLSFLNLIGVMLLLEGMQQHVNKGYIYAAMAFSLFVELLNMRYRRKQVPVKLHEPDMPKQEEPALK